jgi:hypothetical protein
MVELTRDIIDTEHYVVRYVRGGLSEQQREAFEDFCVLHPDVAAQVDTDRALLAGLRGLDHKPVPARIRPAWQYAMAAGIAVVLVAVGAISYRESMSGTPLALRADASELAPRARSALSKAFVISPTRGGRTIEVRVADDVRVLRLDFEPGLHQAAEFDFKLIEHMENGDVDHGSMRLPARQVDGERTVPLLIEIGAKREPRMRLEVTSAEFQESFELRVIRE